MTQEMMGFWDAVATAGPYANSPHFAPDNHTNTSLLNVYRSDALPDAQPPTVSKHCSQSHSVQNLVYKTAVYERRQTWRNFISRVIAVLTAVKDVRITPVALLCITS